MKHYEVKWLENLTFVGKTPSGNSALLDSSVDDANNPTAPSPMEYMILSLAGCTGMDIVSILGKMKKEITDFKIELDAEKGKDYPKVWKEVKMKYIFKGVNLDKASVDKAIELSLTKYCSVYAMFKSSGVKIEYSYEINI